MKEVAAENLPFRHYSLKGRLVSWVSMHLFDSITYTVRHGLLQGMKRKGGLGWVPAILVPELDTEEIQFWLKLNLSGMTVYDIGAFHGLLTLFFANQAKQVVSFEPNSRNRKRLQENLALNRITNVRVRPVGLGSRPGTHRMVADPLMPGGASVDEKKTEMLLHSAVPTHVEEVTIVTLEEDILQSGLPAPDFLKIDIEGFELEALQGARNTLVTYKPALFLEMHGETIAEKKRKVAEIVAFLWDNGYRNIQHIETKSVVTPENAVLAKQGHLYCTAP